MPHTDVIPTSASVASTSNSSFRYIGKHVYILTGAVLADNNETTTFEGSSGSGYIVATFQPVYFQTATGDDAVFKIYFNDIEVFTITVTGSITDTPFNDIHLLIPPLTKLKLTAYNRTDSSGINVGGVLTGRVYGAT